MRNGIGIPLQKGGLTERPAGAVPVACRYLYTFAWKGIYLSNETSIPFERNIYTFQKGRTNAVEKGATGHLLQGPSYCRTLPNRRRVRGMGQIALLCTLWLCVSPVLRAAQAPVADTVYHLGEVMVTAVRNRTEVIPPKALRGQELEQSASFSVADALRCFSGVQVRDYGGIGGIKTIDIRGMGTQHVGFFYDGVELGNAQNGQIDLGQYSLDNIESIEVYHGQKSGYLQTAKDYASSGTVYLTSRTPSFTGTDKRHLYALMRTGSFGLLNTDLRYERKLTPALSLSLNAAQVAATGKYRFRYRKLIPGTDRVAYDTTAVRENGDIASLRLEGGLFGAMPQGRYSVKLYHYGSERGIPGAIVNNVWRRGERMWDNNNFVQTTFNSFANNRLRFSAIAKYAYYALRFQSGTDVPVIIDNYFHQSELYASLAASYELLSGWYASLAYDFLWNSLASNQYNFAEPRRQSHFVALATTYSYRSFEAQASLLGTFIIDRTNRKYAMPRFNRFNPCLLLQWKPFAALPDLALNAFYKQSFRMPTFNDLYYTDFGNPQLEPEETHQLSAGAEYSYRHGASTMLELRVDAYRNKVRNKIVAYPKGQQFRWTMLNLGQVAVTGIDASVQLRVRPWHRITMDLSGRYSYQKAIDTTNPEDGYYRHQIPYIPLHSGTITASVGYKDWLFAYNMQCVGARYCRQENIFANYVPLWHTHDLSLSYDFSFNRSRIRLLAEAKNILNQSYEVIANYPMPGRNYRISIRVSI